MNRIAFVLLGILLLVCSVSGLFAQTTGKIAGLITDKKTGDPLPGTNVIIEGTLLGAAAGPDGRFFILNLPPGTYTVKVQLIGYKEHKIEGVQVSVNRTTNLRVVLEESVIQGEEVVVTADRFSVKKDQTSSIRNVSAEDIALLPVESTGQVVNMQVGVVQGHFRGGRTGEVSYLIDGMSVDNALDRGRSVNLEVDAVQDLEVITGTFNAEYGRAMSGIVNLISKDGSNEFHGSVSGYLGNYYTPHTDIFEHLDRGEIDRNQDFQFSLDGPIIKNHITFAINGRYQKNLNYLTAIRRFKMDDLSDFANYPENYFTEATGDSAIVDYDQDEIYNFSGKLTWKMKNQKISLLYIFNDAEYLNADRRFMYAPDGAARSYPRSHLGTFQWNQMLSQSAFFELKFSYLDQYSGYYLYEDPLDPGYISDTYRANESQTGYFTGGQDKAHNITLTNRYDGKFDITWQAAKNHSLKSGILYTQHQFDRTNCTIQNKYQGTSWENYFYKPDVKSDSTIHSDIYYKEPVEIAVYIQDKMEFDDMVINLGVRYEYFDPNTVYPTQYRNPGNLLDFPDNPERMSAYPKAKTKTYLNPRFGLSYQLGETALLRFSYGHFLQLPPFSSMYQNNSYVLGTTSYETTIGNPNVNPEKTVNYEVGYWQKITSFLDGEVALFYKDIYDLSTVNLVNTYNNVWYGVYGNKDYGNARGLEIKLNMHLSSIFCEVNYTLQYTRGNADNPRFTFDRAGDSQDPIPTLIPLGWDQRHTANFTLGYYKSNFSITSTAYLTSGGVYTWSPLSYTRLAKVSLYPNNDYKPSTFSVDLRGHYNLYEIAGIKVRATLQVYNLFDNLNEYGVNSNTGRANQAIILESDRNAHRADWITYEERIFNPAAYSAPRLVKFGLEFRF